jgi:fatty-acyl-CoA synthase
VTSLLPRLEAAARRGKAVTFVDDDERVEWARLHDDARAAAAALQARGVGPGERVALLAPTSRPLVTGIQASWLCGAAITVLPLKTRLIAGEDYWEQTLARIAVTDSAVVLADNEHAAELGTQHPGLPVVTFDALSADGSARSSAYQPPPSDPDAIAVLQFTSGSTADPKGVTIPHRCLVDNLDGLAERAPIDGDDDVVVSWAPLYHDMGLVMLMTYAMSSGTELVISTPKHFIASPGRWMEWMSGHRATWSIAPNFSFSVAGRMLAAASEKLDLSACRRLGNGSEPIDATAMETFAAAALGHGFDPAAMYGAYGMAEATVLISIPEEGTGFTLDIIDGPLL